MRTPGAQRKSDQNLTKLCQMGSVLVVSGTLKQLKTHGVMCWELLHTQEVIGSRPVDPFNLISSAGQGRGPSVGPGIWRRFAEVAGAGVLGGVSWSGECR